MRRHLHRSSQLRVLRGLVRLGLLPSQLGLHAGRHSRGVLAELWPGNDLRRSSLRRWNLSACRCAVPLSAAASTHERVLHGPRWRRWSLLPIRGVRSLRKRCPELRRLWNCLLCRAELPGRPLRWRHQLRRRTRRCLLRSRCWAFVPLLPGGRLRRHLLRQRELRRLQRRLLRRTELRCRLVREWVRFHCDSEIWQARRGAGATTRRTE